MSGSSTPNAERDTALLSIGAQCYDPTCHLVDFLPFKCQHCAHLFCQDHFKARAVDAPAGSGTGHACAHYDESRVNRIAPSCPLCSTPVAVPPGEDPNVRMDRHIQQECAVTTGRQGAPKSNLPHCARAKCGKVLYAPIGCDKCRQQFCPSHRFPNAHNCSAGVNARPTAAKASSGVSAQQMRQEINQVGARGAAAMAAIKRSLANAPVSSASASASRSPAPPKPAAGVTTTTTSTSSAAQKKLNPFSATDR
ncbi:hypothetical protein PUNSTDRAFT_61734 [Punctularia strigosozonata HHB-11173 SS5]|uniref:uncharacterized protein n=1 Tax=Punctularia strigosozonata (strain HHB-11173) TaxID=741275 RepID=UPI00044177C6|nr:uncharacterized protein PUNSTDRAFT_61734 [Punctularia strigosozonata HHB-11173 SS5]EIN12980.1 hypothetical protein PUNSTDRAFT_61734 [Punctularia strigosozonata HHB-11173 SS5]